MMTINQERDISAAQLLLTLTSASQSVPDTERESYHQDLLQDAWTLVDRAGLHTDSLRLKAIISVFRGLNDEAIHYLRAAITNGDRTAQIRLAALLRQQGQVAAAEEVIAQIAQDIAARNPSVLWAVVRDSALGVVPQPFDESEFAEIAAKAGLPDAMLFQLGVKIDRGDSDTLDRLRALSGTSAIALRLARYLTRVGLGSALNDESGEAKQMARLAHEQGEMRATYFLWFKTEAPADAEFESVLEERFINGDRRRDLGALEYGGAGLGASEVAADCARNGNHLAALRMWQAAALLGDDSALAALGDMLVEEAGSNRAWATFGAFLRQWPDQIRSDSVGSAEYPLSVASRPPALRDDHSGALEIEASDFARRILEVFEQVGWKLNYLGDHLLMGHWRADSGPLQIYIEISGENAKADSFAYISTPLLVGVPGAPWAAPSTSADEVGGWVTCVDRVFREDITSMGGFAQSFDQPQRRALEALFRLGENDSRDYILEPLGFLMTLGGVLGRVMTFDSTPKRLYPHAWASASASDYISSGKIETHPEAHRCAEPVETLYVGYTLSNQLSGGHLRGALGGTVHSLMMIQDYATQMFDQDPTIFNEFFRAIPTGRILEHRDVFGGAVPDLGANLTRSGGRAADAMTHIRDMRHQVIGDPDADPLAINSAAWGLLQDGQLDEAMTGFDRAASLGQPNALASLIWNYLKEEQIDQAIQAFEDYFPRTDRYLATCDPDLRAVMHPQLANSQSNAGLAYLATGNQSEALRLWRQAAGEGHLEARAFPGVLAHRNGEPRLARKILKHLSQAERMEFRETMDDVRVSACGWFQEWASDAISALDHV